MQAPFFSIIITTYNRPDKIIKAIDSVLAQEFENFELIIVNDGSVVSYDNVQAHIKDDQRINYLYKSNGERSVARNYAIERARGEWLCFLDDDDIYYPKHLTFRYAAISAEKTENCFFYSPCIHRLADGSIKKSVIPPYSGIDTLIYSGFHISTVCLPVRVAKSYKFNPDLSYFEDFEYWLRIFIDGKLRIIMINEYTTEYVFHDMNTVSNLSSGFLLMKIKTFEYLRENYSANLPKSFLYGKLYMAYLNMADCMAQNKKKKESLRYLLKAMKFKTDFADLPYILAIFKNGII
jgi:glycosyltransferase involved in cell wall biosynthesis